ncbi:hypothetical protein ACFSTH_08215 [Paenibacillus yanchengensis]|uniref:Uncharacterized protein n=1 Tax=Paenibacillus yanchengensis TaxID=2035833 RepID=A0ABW4YLK6_9BACL
MEKRENGFGQVKSYFMTPEQIAEMDRKAREKNEGPRTWKWERTMTKEQYLQAVAEGRSRGDIILKHFNNDPREFRKQLKDWEMTEEEAMELAKVAKPIDLTKEQYLQRRLNGEKRTQIINSLGIAKPRAYELLKEWGIRELDAEECELELLAPAREAKEVDKRVSEQIEQKVEARSDQQWHAEVVNELERTDAGEEILKRIEQRSEAQEQEIANLQAEIAQLKGNRNDLLKTIGQAASTDTGMITFHIPILPVQVAIIERTRIYDALESLGHGIEGAEIDRQRVALELFELLQRIVNFVTADLTELHPGQDATAFIHRFFGFYNDQHIQSASEALSDLREVG